MKQEENYEEQEETLSLNPKILAPKFIDFLNTLSSGIFKLIQKHRQISNNEQNINQKFCKSKKTNRRKSFKISNPSNRFSRGFRVLAAERNDKGDIEGQAHLQYEDKSKFKGQFSNGVRQKGRITYQTGVQFQCSFLNDEFDGICTLYSPSGTVIETHWSDGIMEPRGKITYGNGDVYNGGMKRFKKHGFGEMHIVKKNQKYIGEFEEGHVTGWGLLYENQKLLGEGNWKKGKLIPQSNASESSSNSIDLNSMH